MALDPSQLRAIVRHVYRDRGIHPDAPPSPEERAAWEEAVSVVSDRLAVVPEVAEEILSHAM